MAFQFGDTAAHYAAADVGKKWTSATISSINATGNPFGGPAIVMQGGTQLVAKTLSSLSSWVAGMRFALGNLASSAAIIEFADAASGIQVDLRVTPAGALQVTRNGTILATSSAGLILPSTWYHIQFKATINGTTGSYAVRLSNTVPPGLPDATNVNTKAQTVSTVDTIRFKLAPTSVTTGSGACDFYICDLTGSTNNDFMGDVRGYLLLPAGAGNYTQWTPLSGANYTNVDETSANGDTDYNYDGTVGHIDSYTMADLPSGYAVKAVQAVAELRKDDAGSRGAAIFARQGVTDVVGSTIALLDSYLFYTQPWDTDPSDSTPWTAAKVNSLEIGAKVVS